MICLEMSSVKLICVIMMEGFTTGRNEWLSGLLNGSPVATWQGIHQSHSGVSSEGTV